MHLLEEAGHRAGLKDDSADVLAGTFDTLAEGHVDLVIEVAQKLDSERVAKHENMATWCKNRATHTRAPRKRKKPSSEDTSEPSEPSSEGAQA